MKMLLQNNDKSYFNRPAQRSLRLALARAHSVSELSLHLRPNTSSPVLKLRTEIPTPAAGCGPKSPPTRRSLSLQGTLLLPAAAVRRSHEQPRVRTVTIGRTRSRVLV
jgi:hypothetical protein